MNRLDLHDGIGWDFDGTLYGHRNSHRFADYIKENAKKRHFIVTFRSHGMQERIWEDFWAIGVPLRPTDFDGVLNVTDELWEMAMMAENALKRGLEVPRHLLKARLRYREWKAITCKEHALSVLVDDRPEDVIEACQKHSIAFFHPDEFDVTRP